jgi:hypothetical protein
MVDISNWQQKLGMYDEKELFDSFMNKTCFGVGCFHILPKNSAQSGTPTVS